MKRNGKIKTMIISILVALGLIFSFWQIRNFTRFPGNLAKPFARPTTHGVRSTFRGGIVYRYPNQVPLVQLKGNYYEMGLQYGVLLRPEILKALPFYRQFLQWQAHKWHLPFPLLTAYLKYKARRLLQKLPQRFKEEIKGVARGAGLSEDVITMVSLFYDLSMAMGCTSILMKGKDGTIIHGRNNDWFEGTEIGQLTLVVRYQAPGYNQVTHIAFPLWMGVETGYNDQGLTFSEQTYGIKKPNPNGFPIVYLARMALEQCSNLEQVYQFFKQHQVIGGHGTVWSDRKTGRGVLIELTPGKQVVIKIKQSLFWNFNHVLSDELKSQQRNSTDLTNWNVDRERLALDFPTKSFYDVKEAAQFLRKQNDGNGINYAWHGSKTAICNDCNIQTVIFDPYNNGFYLAYGAFFAACQQMFYIHDDFSKRPELFLQRLALKPLPTEVAAIKHGFWDDSEKLKALLNLASTYPSDAQLNFWISLYALHLGQWNLFVDHALKAYTMEPSASEFQLFAALAFYHQQQLNKAIELLENLNPTQLSLLENLYRLSVLKKAYRLQNPTRAQSYQNQLTNLLTRHGLQKIFKKEIVPLIDRLSSKN